jgi:hypothetical protein
MSRQLFVDTGAWIALADADDQYHERAAQVYPEFLRKYQRLVTTNLVIAEAYIAIRRALTHRAAMAFLDRLSQSPRIEKVYSDPTLEAAAHEILRQYEDQDFSYVDAVSFALMRQRGITEAFAFDRHFAIAGFVLVPSS